MWAQGKLTKLSWPVRFWFTDVLYLLQLMNKFHAAYPFTDVNIFSVFREIPASLLEPEGSLPYIQEPITDPHLSQMNPGRSPLYTFYLRPISVLVYHIWGGLPSRLFHFRFSD